MPGLRMKKAKTNLFVIERNQAKNQRIKSPRFLFSPNIIEMWNELGFESHSIGSFLFKDSHGDNDRLIVRMGHIHIA